MAASLAANREAHKSKPHSFAAQFNKAYPVSSGGGLYCYFLRAILSLQDIPLMFATKDTRDMSTIHGEVSICRPVSDVYAYLRNRYESEVFRSICMTAKGRVLEIQCLEEQANERLSFSVAGSDSLLGFKTPGWKWEYRLSAIGDEGTKVGITYRWGIGLSLLSAFTAGAQAANEIIETALALHALEANKTLHPNTDPPRS